MHGTSGIFTVEGGHRVFPVSVETIDDCAFVEHGDRLQQGQPGRLSGNRTQITLRTTHPSQIAKGYA